MKNMSKEEAIRNYVEGLSTGDLRDVVNDINGWDGSLDNLQYYTMDEFDELMGSYTPIEIAQLVSYGDFNPCDDYYGFDGYGNLKSYSDYELDKEIDMYKDDIVDCLMSFDGSLYDDTLQGIVNADEDALFDEDYEEIDEDEDDDE